MYGVTTLSFLWDLYLCHMWMP